MNRKQRNDRKSILYIRERRYADHPRTIPLKDWIKRLARAHRHNRPAAIQMFDARFGELAGSPLFKAARFLFIMACYRHTGNIRLTTILELARNTK